MRFEWDENRNRTNKSEHGIDFDYARRLWDDPNYLILLDVNSFDEERWLAIGNVDHTTSSSQFILTAETRMIRSSE